MTNQGGGLSSRSRTIQSRWRAELQRTAPGGLALNPAPFPLDVTVHSRRDRTESGLSFGETLLRVVATPFAVVGDAATGLLVLAVAALREVARPDSEWAQLWAESGCEPEVQSVVTQLITDLDLIQGDILFTAIGSDDACGFRCKP